MREQYVTECALQGLRKVEKVHTTEQAADILTKPLSAELLRKHSIALGLNFAKDCGVCKLAFESNNELHAHIRAEHGGPSRPGMFVSKE